MTEPAPPAVLVSGVTMTFPVPFRRRSVVALHDLNLRVEPGEVYGLLGPNGSGKSTTLKIILGLVAPTRGRAEIFGRGSDEVASRESVGFLPESPYFPKYLTAAETLRFFGKLAGLSGKKLENRIDEMLATVGLTSDRDRRLAGFSKGMLQRIGLAQALIHEPRLVVLDEPTAGVDPAGSSDIRDLILDLKKRGVTVLLSSHLLGQVQEICDRVGILAGGVLVREGHLDELLARAEQNEIVFENTPDALPQQIEELIRAAGGRVLANRKSRTTLERLFLEATRK
ncbi:MAG: ABC transporter ATP-binding protein [Verrucomicrobiota bacterium]|nr:ABC transporter ATP-binding protein [Verrucomicrobiota bacterium]